MILDKYVDRYFFNTKNILGRGSYGCVYKGIDQSTSTFVAIKIISKSIISDDPYLWQALIREVKILKELDSKHVVKLLDTFESESNYYLIQELCSEGDLKQLLLKRDISEKFAINILHNILQGYQYLLDFGIVHRDIKPANVLISNGTFKLSDFGFATHQASSQMLTSCVGSPLYMSPQILDDLPYTNKCDIWSIGILYYQCLYGITPWIAQRQMELLSKIKNEPLQFPNAPYVSEKSKKFIRKCLQYYENDRMSWNEIYKHELFSGHKFNQLDSKVNVIVAKIKNFMTKNNTKIEQVIQSYAQLKIISQQEIEKFLYIICPSLFQEEVKLLLQSIINENQNNVEISQLIQWLEKTQIHSQNRQNFQPSSPTQIKTNYIEKLVQDMKMKFIQRNLNLCELFAQCGLNEIDDISLTEFDKLMKHIDKSLTKVDINLIFFYISNERVSIKKDQLVSILIDESELLDGDEESTVSPLSTGIQGPGSKLNSMKNLEGIF